MNFNFDIYRRIAMLWSFFEFQSCLRVAYKNLFSKRFYLFLSKGYAEIISCIIWEIQKLNIKVPVTVTTFLKRQQKEY